MKKNVKPNSLESASAHSIGKVRRYNEDALYVFQSEIMRLDHTETLGLYVVADGMGGHANGDKASACAVTAFVYEFTRQIFPIFLEFDPEEKDLLPLLQACVMSANEAILTDYPGSGTTFTAALVWGGTVYSAHVGDSRLFLFDKNGESQRLTHDHSLVQMMVDLGEITEEEALNHPRRSVLLRSLGFDQNVEVDCAENKITAGDTLLLCCDGLWSEVPERELAKILEHAGNPQAAADAMVAASNDAGGPDNISCILIRVS